jgi:type III pantothenate kinase
MLLAIDAGNTNIVFSAFSGSELVGSWRGVTQAERTADEHAAFLLNWLRMAEIDPRKIRVAIISSVVPEANFQLRRLCETHLGVVPLFVGDPRLELGLQIKIDRPEELGADRIVNAVAARAHYAPPLLVVDFGTATTIDYVDAAGDYCGGVIAPGARLSIQALHLAAAKLPRVAVAAPPKVIGTNTVGAMQSGIFYGYLGMIEGLIARIKHEAGHATMAVIATGGLAALFAHHTTLFTAHDPDLTLRGLKLIYDRNHEKVAPQ